MPSLSHDHKNLVPVQPPASLEHDTYDTLPGRLLPVLQFLLQNQIA